MAGTTILVFIPASHMVNKIVSVAAKGHQCFVFERDLWRDQDEGC